MSPFFEEEFWKGLARLHDTTLELRVLVDQLEESAYEHDEMLEDHEAALAEMKATIRLIQSDLKRLEEGRTE